MPRESSTDRALAILDRIAGKAKTAEPEDSEPPLPH